MARFAVVLSLAVVVIIAIQTTKVLGVAVDDSCGLNDSCDPCPLPYGPACCDGLENGVAADGTVYALSSGVCSCCNANGSGNVCRTDNSSSIGTNPSGANADATTQLTSCQPQSP